MQPPRPRQPPGMRVRDLAQITTGRHTTRPRHTGGGSLTVHHLPLVIAVIIAVRRPVVDVEALDGGVVVAGGGVLGRDRSKDHLGVRVVSH